MMPVAPVVFLVGDDPSVRKSLTRLLTSASYSVEAFASAREFLARERYAGPCCLVLDVRMPGLTGLDLQETLVGAGRRMSIVFVTEGPAGSGRGGPRREHPGARADADPSRDRGVRPRRDRNAE
jgi:FixJ family two-component response regulator